MSNINVSTIGNERQINDDAAFIDSDTIRREGDVNVRLENINAPETQHFIEKEGYWPWSDSSLNVTQADFQGQALTDEVARLSREQGYTNVVGSGYYGKYGREIGRLENEYGEDIGEALAYEDITSGSQYDSDQLTQLRDQGVFGRLLRKDENAFDESRNRLNQGAKDSFLGWKRLAMNESVLNAYNTHGDDGTYGQYQQGDVEFRHQGQTAQGQAYNSFTTGIQGGANNLQESFFGAASAIGDLINSEGLYDWGRINAMAQEDDTAEMGKFINDIGRVDSAGDFGQYVSGMAGQMLPYLAGLWAAGTVGVALGGPVGLAISFGAPGLIYAGEIYNGMEGKAEDKNVGYALAGGLIAGTVDRLALNGLVKTGDLLGKSAQKQLAEKYATKFGVSDEVAKKAVSRAYAQSQADLMKDLGIVKLKLDKKLIAQEAGLGFMQGSTKESLTEVIQEGTIYASQVLGSPKAFDGTELQHVLTNAAVGGFVLGGAIGTSRGAKSYGDFIQQQRDWSSADGDPRSGYYKGTTESNLKEASDEAIDSQTKLNRTRKDVAKLSEAEYAQGLADDTVRGGGLKKFLGEGPKLYIKKVGDRIMHDYYPAANERAKFIMATLTSNFANTTESTMEGVSHKKTKSTVQAQQSMRIRTIEQTLTDQLGFTTKLGKGKFSNKDGKARASVLLRNYMRYQDQGKKLTDEMLNHRKVLDAAMIKMNILTDQNADIVESQSGEKVGRVSNYFGKATRLSPEMIRNNPDAFRELTEYLQMDGAEAKAFYDEIMGAPEGYQPSKLQKLGFRTTNKPGGLKEVKANIKDFKRISELTSDNYFDQMVAISDEDINFALDMNRLGDQGSKVDAMLMELKQEMGADWDPRINTWIKDSISASRGDYRKIKSKFGQDMQNWVLWFNALTQLDTSTLASLPELAMILYGQGKAGKGLVNDTKVASKSVGRKFLHTFEKTRANMFENYGISSDEYDAAVDDFYRLGYENANSSAAALESSEAGEGAGKEFREKTMKAFFNINLLEPFTNASRVARLALAGQAIIGDLETMASLRGINNNMEADAFARLRDLNVDPDRMTDAFDAFINTMPIGVSQDQIFQKLVNDPAHSDLLAMFDNAKTSYVDNVLARPTHEDRPLWYSNPHYKLLTQYTGFLSTFTANTLPRLWKDFKSKNPAAKYQAYAAAMTMLAMGFIGQEMKDDIYGRSYGQIPQGLDYYQRGLQSSGLIGTGERWLDAAHPVYGDAGILNFSTQKGLSLGDSLTAQFGPSYGTAGKFVSFIDKIASGKDTGDSVWDLIPGGKLAKSWDSIAGNPTGEYLFDRR